VDSISDGRVVKLQSRGNTETNFPEVGSGSSPPCLRKMGLDQFHGLFEGFYDLQIRHRSSPEHLDMAFD